MTPNRSQERRCRVAFDITLTAATVLDQYLPGLEAGHGLLAHSLLERHFHVVDDCRVRLVEGHTVFKTCEEVDPVAAPVVKTIKVRLQHATHAEWDEDLWSAEDVGAIEPGWVQHPRW